MTEPTPTGLPPIKPELKKLIDAGFADGRTLWHDASNALMPMSMKAVMGDYKNIRPLETYEEYFRRKASGYQEPDAYYNYVINKSNPSRVAEYNARIDAFNAELPQIKLGHHNDRVQEFFQEMTAFLLA